MAASSTPTAEQNEVRRKGRQRLIGAVAIVLLAIVFVPMVLDSEPRSVLPEQSLAIPPKEDAPALPAPAKVVETPKAVEKPAEAAPVVEPAMQEPAKPAVVTAVVEPKPAEAKPAPTKSAAAPKLAGFAIQVGAFRDEEKLNQAREKLVAAKIAHFTERLASGDLTRLRAGPYPTREAAEKAVAAVKLAGLEGKVVTLP